MTDIVKRHDAMSMALYSLIQPRRRSVPSRGISILVKSRCRCGQTEQQSLATRGLATEIEAEAIHSERCKIWRGEIGGDRQHGARRIHALLRDRFLPLAQGAVSAECSQF